MANEFARNIQDASLNPATFALPSSASSSTTSAWIDLGLDTLKPANIEIDLALPALNATMAPDTRTFTAIFETSANASTVDATIFSRTLTGSGGTGIAAQTGLRSRLPSNCARYVRAKVTSGASTADASSLSGTFTLRF